MSYGSLLHRPAPVHCQWLEQFRRGHPRKLELSLESLEWQCLAPDYSPLSTTGSGEHRDGEDDSDPDSDFVGTTVTIDNASASFDITALREVLLFFLPRVAHAPICRGCVWKGLFVGSQGVQFPTRGMPSFIENKRSGRICGCFERILLPTVPTARDHQQRPQARDRASRDAAAQLSTASSAGCRLHGNSVRASAW